MIHSQPTRARMEITCALCACGNGSGIERNQRIPLAILLVLVILIIATPRQVLTAMNHKQIINLKRET